MEPDSGELFFYLFGGPCGHNFRRVQTACRNSLSGNIMSRNRFRDLSITRSNYVCMCMYFIRQRTIQQRHCKNSSRQDSQTVSQNYHYFPVFLKVASLVGRHVLAARHIFPLFTCVTVLLANIVTGRLIHQ